MAYLIDGNNLLYAAPAHLPGPAVGRQRLCEILALWAKRTTTEVTVVFDGPRPRPSFEAQMRAGGIAVVFSAPRSADEVIEELIDQASAPASLCVVSGDRAVQSAARRRRCSTVASAQFARELATLLAPARNAGAASDQPPAPPEKPGAVSPEETDEWLRRFDLESGELRG